MKSTEKILTKHYNDMLNLNKLFINAISRPRIQTPTMIETSPNSRKKLTKKQLKALAQGRQKLAEKRAKILQI